MNDTIKKLAKFLCIGSFWVFFLSISINNRTIFSYANEILVQNPLVEYLDGELGDFWSKVKETARVTYAEITNADEKV